MVDRLDANDLRYEFVVVIVNVLDEFEFCHPRADHEYLLRRFQRASDVAIKVLRVGGVIPFGRHGEIPSEIHAAGMSF
jgi:hypothetical protein